MDFYTDGDIGGIPTFEAFLLYLLIVFLIYLGITAYGNNAGKREQQVYLQRARRPLHRHSIRTSPPEPAGRKKQKDLLDSKLESDILKDLFKTEGVKGSSSSAALKPVTVNELIVKAVDKFETEKKAVEKPKSETGKKAAERKASVEKSDAGKKTEKKALEYSEAVKKAAKNFDAGSDYDWMDFLKTSDSKPDNLSKEAFLSNGETAAERGRTVARITKRSRKNRSRSTSITGIRKASK